MFVLEHVNCLHFLGKQNSSKRHSFCRVYIGVIRFSELKCYNTSWHRNIQLLFSFIFQSETTVEGFIASQAPQTRKVSSLTSP